MAGTVEHLTVDELEARFRAAKEVVERSHCQVVWLLAKGHSTREVAELVALSPWWVNKLKQRYAAEGADALGDRRRRNAGARPLLSAADLEALRERLETPPADGGVWTGPKSLPRPRPGVARWIAARLGLVHVHVVWVTKYRYRVLGGDVGHRCRELLRETARGHELVVPAGSVNRDHVHMLLSIPPSLSVSRAVQHLKGHSSHKLLSEFGSLRKRYWGQHLWTRGYWIATSGNVTDEMWAEYIKNQTSPEPDDDFHVT